MSSGPTNAKNPNAWPATILALGCLAFFAFLVWVLMMMLAPPCNG